MKRVFYVTTPIYYPNDIPHIGHAYTTILADVLARWHRLVGDDVFFLTGTDEHGLKLQRTAEKKGLKPKEFVDKMAEIYKEYWAKLNISYNRFIRTTDPDHEETVKKALQKLYDKGYVYKGVYKGWYCVSCEKYYSEKEYEVIEGKPHCPIHKKPLEYVEEEGYFLKLSQFEDYMLKLLEKEDIIYPQQYAREVYSRLKKEGLQDVSISRPRSRVYWGIELPFDSSHTVYVWIDALLNYVSGIGYLRDDEKFEKYWSNVHHIIGKDILWFHTVIWFSVLKMLDIEPPKKLLVHAYITRKGLKMGKSVGNVIQIEEVLDRYYGESDVLRYLLMRNLNYGRDVEVTWELLDSIYNGELLGNYGNLVRRIGVIALRKANGIIERSEEDEKLAEKIKEEVEEVKKYYDNYEVSSAILKISETLHFVNAYMNETKPWALENPVPVLYNLLEALRINTLLLSPVIPITAEKVSKALGFTIDKGLEQFKYGYVEKYHVVDAPILFKKLKR